MEECSEKSGSVSIAPTKSNISSCVPAQRCTVRKEEPRYLQVNVREMTCHLIGNTVRTVGPLSQKYSATKNTTIPTPPTMRGASTCGDVHGNRSPPQVIARRIETVLPVIRETPLMVCERQGNWDKDAPRSDSRPINLNQLVAEAGLWSIHAQEDKRQRERDSA